MRATPSFLVFAALIAAPLLTAAPALADELPEDHPWAPLGFEAVESDVGTIYLDPALDHRREEVREKIESQLTQIHERWSRDTDFHKDLPEAIRHVNEILGVEPDEELANTQRKMAEFFATYGRDIGERMVGPEELRILVALAGTLKRHLRDGGSLPQIEEAPGDKEISFTYRFLESDKKPAKPVKRLHCLIDKPESPIEITEMRAVEKMITSPESPSQFITLHEIAELTILGSVHYTKADVRWFNDGMASTIAAKVLRRLGRENTVEHINTKTYNPEEYEDLRHRLNLRYWPIVDYEIKSPLDPGKRLRLARYTFSYQLTTLLVNEHGIGIVRRIMDRALDGPVSAERLIKIVSEVTGEDIAATLAEYQTFDTAEQGIEQYQRRYVEARRNGDLETAFESLRHLNELVISRHDYRPGPYVRAAHLLREMGHIEKGAEILQAQLEEVPDLVIGPENEARAQDFYRAKLIEYALAARRPCLAYDAADELLANQPEHRPARLIRHFRLAAEQGEAAEDSRRFAQDALDDSDASNDPLLEQANTGPIAPDDADDSADDDGPNADQRWALRRILELTGGDPTAAASPDSP